jgi:hypothetical protein
VLWRVLAVVPLVLFVSGCGDDNHTEISNLKNQVEQSRKEARDLKASIGTEVANLKERLDRLEAQPPQIEPTKKPPPPATNDADAIKQAIADCVRKVRGLETKPASNAWSGRPYAEFDAYYNQGNGHVENNNRYVDQGPNYAFNKCMASKGVPLT